MTSLRHAAALALVGWYLMVPPRVPQTHQVNEKAKLSEWRVVTTLPHKDGCEFAKDQLLHMALAAQANVDATGKTPQENPESRCALCKAQCVATDDPRLKP